MKNKQIGVLFLVLAVILSGCNLGMMNSVQIVTNPTLEVSLGERLNVFSEFLDIDQELNDMTVDTEGLEQDTTVTTGNPISLHLEQDMIDISINDFAGETLALDTVDQAIDPVTFDIPSIGTSESIALGFDPIDLPIDASVPPIPLTAIPEVNTSITRTTPQINASGFDTLTFATGTLNGAVTVTNGSAGLTVRITSATIMDGATAVASASNTPLNANGTLVFDLAGVELPSSFTMDLGITITGGAGISQDFDMDVAFTFSADTTVSAATGITVDQQISDSVTIPVTSTDLISAVIGTGSIDIDLTYDSSWTNLATTIDLALKQGGSTISSVTGVTVADPAEWDLSGVTIGSGDLTLDYTVYVDSTSPYASDFSVASGTDEITGTAASSITNFSSLTMSATGMNFQQEQATNLGSDITDLVQTINFGATACVTVALANNLPTDIDVTITSAALSISGTHTFLAGDLTGTNTWDILGAGNALTVASVADSAIDADTDPDVDFTVDISLAGFDEANEELTLTNVAPGASYSLSGSVVADLTIDSVVIASASMSDQFPSAGADPLDFSMLGDFLPDSITFEGISASFDLTMDAGSLSLDMLVYAQYDDAGGTGQNLPLVGTDTNSDGIPDTPRTASGNDSISLDGIGTLINNRASNIVIYYDVTASGATVSFDNSVDQRIAAAVTADIPFTMKASENASLTDADGNPIIEAATEDLFGRDGSADDEDINDYLSMLSSAGINLVFTTPANLAPAGEGLLGIGFSMTEDTNPAGYGDFSLVKELIINKAESTELSISITPEQIERIIADDAFMPSYDIYLIGEYTDAGHSTLTGYSGDHQIVEGFDMDITATMSVRSDVDYTIDLGGNN